MSRVVIKCGGCGLLRPYSAMKQVVNDGTGHHVIPDDPENDWICHGDFAIAENKDLIDLSKEDLDAMRLDAAQPTKADLVTLGEQSTEARCAAIEAASAKAEV